MTSKLIIGDVFDALRTIPDGSVDLVMTSPPFLALRSYLPADHPDKGKEIGSEATPADFIDTLLSVVEECRRVLAPHGSLVFELGDTFSGSGGSGGDYNAGGLRDGAPAFKGSAKTARFDGRASSSYGTGSAPRPPRGLLAKGSLRDRAADEAAGIRAPTSRPGPEGRDRINGWPLDKSLTGIPTIFTWSLAYGRNLLRPDREIEPWRIRNLVVWARPNPPVGALADKFRPATSYLTVATMAQDRWFDMEPLRHHNPRAEEFSRTRAQMNRGAPGFHTGEDESNAAQNPAGAPMLDWWEIPTTPYKGSHYATFPPELPRRVILSMCPEKVCVTCGEPSRRIIETERVRVADGTVDPPRIPPTRDDAERNGGSTAIGIRHAVESRRTTTGWTTCGHDNWRRGVVLDPFVGSGTTMQVATRLGREAIGIDLDERNHDLIQKRVGMFLTDVVYLSDSRTSTELTEDLK